VSGLVRLLLVGTPLTVSFFLLSLRRGGPRRTLYLGLFLLFWIVVAEAAMVRNRAPDEVLAGSFSQAAYGEAALWAVLGLILFVATWANPQRLRPALRPPLVWVTAFGLLATASSGYASDPTYSFVWSLKLLLVVGIAAYVASGIRSADDLRSVLRCLWGAFLLSAVLPFGLAQVDPEANVFWGSGTLGGTWGYISVSEAAALLVILSIALGDWTHRRFYRLAAIVGCVVLFIGLGKAVMVAAGVGVVVYELSLSTWPSALRLLGYSTAVAVLVGAMWVTGATGIRYLTEYAASDQMVTLSGRLGLWEQAFLLVRERWLFGHGYLSSRFLFQQVAPGWSPTSLHNAFLETWYNTGLLGLFLIAGLHVGIIRSLVRIAIRRRWLDRYRRVAFAVVLGLYAHINVNGLASPYFGGHANKGFILLIVTAVMAEALARLSMSSAALGAVAADRAIVGARRRA
jgi:O-antigen ligase